MSDDGDYWRQQAHDVMAELHERETQLGTALAELLDLRDVATDLVNVLTTLRHPDLGGLWRLGGTPLETAYQVLKDALAARREAERTDDPPF